MPVIVVRSFSKINLGLRIGAKRADGFHELRTIYQTIALHDILRVKVERGSGIEIRCADQRVPVNEANTCYPMVERVMAALQPKRRVIVEIEKRLPVQGGLGGASGNAVAAMLAVERAFGKPSPGAERLRIAAEVGSDLPLFLIGGTVLGAGRGEEVYPLPDLPTTPCVIATPEIGVSTPKAFADWDAGMAAPPSAAKLRSARTCGGTPSHAVVELGGASLKLTPVDPSDKMGEFGRRVSSWLSGVPEKEISGARLSGVPARGRGRAEILLLDLVRTGIENDFERVVFPQYPELRDVKRVLERSGAYYASLSGSGSAVYGLFPTKTAAGRAARQLRRRGVPAQATMTLTRAQYWRTFRVSAF